MLWQWFQAEFLSTFTDIEPSVPVSMPWPPTPQMNWIQVKEFISPPIIKAMDNFLSVYDLSSVFMPYSFSQPLGCLCVDLELVQRGPGHSLSPLQLYVACVHFMDDLKQPRSCSIPTKYLVLLFAHKVAELQ